MMTFPNAYHILDISYADLNTSSTSDTMNFHLHQNGVISALQELMVLLAVELYLPLACPAGVSRKMEQDLLSSFLKVERAQMTHLALHGHNINTENLSPNKVQGASTYLCDIQCAEMQILHE